MPSNKSEQSDKRKEPLVPIATAPNEAVANMWKDVLAENGIQCLLRSLNLATSLYVSSLTLQFQVLVLASDADKAKEVLAPFIEAEENPD